jgi:hypothetical protein
MESIPFEIPPGHYLAGIIFFGFSIQDLNALARHLLFQKQTCVRKNHEGGAPAAEHVPAFAEGFCAGRRYNTHANKRR